MFAELSDRAIERLDGPVRAGQHHAAFHDNHNISREGVEVRFRREGRLHCLEALADGIDPALEILRD